MRTLRLGLLVTGCLALGFVAGWQSHRPTSASLTTTPATPHPVTATPKDQAKPAAVTPTRLDSARVRSTTPAVSERLALLRWLKENGMRIGISLFDHDGLTAQFALLYGLTAAETAQLNQASLPHQVFAQKPASSAGRPSCTQKRATTR